MQRLRLMILTAAVAVAACGESTGLVGDITEEEATELAAVVFMTAFMSAPEPQSEPAPVGGPQMAPYSYSEDVEVSAECALDGFADVSGSLDVQGDTQSEAGRTEYVLTLEHQGCTAASPNDVVFTLHGAPSVTLHLVAENDGQGNVTLEGSLDGAVAWAAEGRDGGVCDVDITFDGAISAESVSFAVHGSICRHSIDASAVVG